MSEARARVSGAAGRLFRYASRGALACCCCAVAGAAAAFQAADTRGAYSAIKTIAVGDEIQGSLGEANVSSDIGYSEDYKVHLKTGETVQIDLESIDFDAILELRREDGSVLLRDDDGGEPPNSRLRFTPGREGDYVIRAGSLSEPGGFELKVSRISLASVSPEWFEGDLAKTDGVTDVQSAYPSLDSPYKLYKFHGKAGERIVIEMRSAAFDSELRLWRDSAGTPFLITDDDSAGSKDARIAAVLPTDSDYAIYAVDTDMKPGSYSISVRRSPARMGPPAPIRIRPGRCSATLDLKDPATEAVVRSSGQIGSFYRMFVLPVTEGQKVTIDLVSRDTAAMDPVLEIGVPSPAGFAIAQTSDDISQGDKNSRLSFVASKSGDLQLRARAFKAAGGPFTLIVSAGTAPAAAGNSCPGR